VGMCAEDMFNLAVESMSVMLNRNVSSDNVLGHGYVVASKRLWSPPGPLVSQGNICI
jgi:hypothetical protein